MSQADSAPVPPSPAQPPPSADGGDPEVVYFEGRPTLRAAQLKATIWLLIGIALIALPIVSHMRRWHWPGLVMAISVILGIAAIVLPWLLMRATRYRITSYRIEYERGILKRRIDTLELWHVNDIQFEQGLVDRMFNVGDITVLSSDKTTPKLELEGVPSPRDVFNKLQQRIIVVKRQRGVIKMDAG